MQIITLAQRKIIKISFVIILVFLFFWLLIYIPSQKTALRIKSELYGQEEQVRIIEEIIDKTKTIEGSERLLEGRLQNLKNKFSGKEEESIKMFSELAKRLKIEMVSIKPQPKKPYLDEDNKRIEIAGKSCQVVSVYIEMRCFYKDLVRYLELLNKNLPAFEIIERLKISREKLTTPRLHIILELNLYFLV